MACQVSTTYKDKSSLSVTVKMEGLFNNNNEHSKIHVHVSTVYMVMLVLPLL